MNRTAVRTFALLAALALPVSASAYRPFDSTDADVAELHHIEIEMGPVGYLATGNSQVLELPSLVLNYGFLPGWEVVLEGVPTYSLTPPAGNASRWALTDTLLTVKHVLHPGVLQEAAGPSVATEFGLWLPSTRQANDPSEGPAFGPWEAIIISWRASILTFHLNLAIEGTRNLKPGTEDGLIIEGPEAWPVRPVVELLFEYVKGGDYSSTGLGGAIWKINDAWSLDAAFRAGQSNEGLIREVRAGFTWSFNPTGGD